MKKTIDELFLCPYRVIDILPEQVPPDSPGQYFAVEKYFLSPERLAGVKQKHIDLVLKLNCYRSISLDEGKTFDPPPEQTAAEMRRRSVCILVDDAMIVSDPDDTHMTLYAPDGKLLALVKAIASGEGLFVWQPEQR